MSKFSSWLQKALHIKEVPLTPAITAALPVSPGGHNILETTIHAIDPNFTAQVEAAVNAGVVALCAKYGITPLEGEIESFIDPEIEKLLTATVG